MGIMNALIIEDVFDAGDGNGPSGEALVTVDGSGVTITEQGSAEPIRIVFTRAEWEAINKLAQREWAEPTMGGRE